MTGTGRSGIRGMDNIPITGRLFSKSTLIGAIIALASIMTRIFIIDTIGARAKDGRKDSMAAPWKDPRLGEGAPTPAG